MAYPHRNPYGVQGQYPTQSSAAYGGYGPQYPSSAEGAASRRTSSATLLVWAVLVLGLTTYLVSYAALPQADGTGWGVRFSMLAAVVAALGLLPRQSAHTKLVVALAVMGFLEALSQLITGNENPHWATITIVILNALQALTANAALLAQLKVPDAADRGLAPYDAYAYYAQAAQQYYAASNQQLQQPVQAQGTAQAEAAASAQAQQSAAERYALYTDYLTAQQSSPNRAASSQSGGRRQTAKPAAGTGIPTSGQAESLLPGTDPTTGPPTQSFS
jgi:Family of unknown function (DUF5336)